jgi:hypothetical protein
MTEEQKLLIVAMTISACKEEIGEPILSIIEASDKGSPWGRAFIRMTDELKEMSGDDSSP